MVVQLPECFNQLFKNLIMVLGQVIEQPPGKAPDCLISSVLHNCLDLIIYLTRQHNIDHLSKNFITIDFRLNLPR